MPQKMLTAGVVVAMLTGLVWWLLQRTKKVKPVKGKVVLITGSSSGLGEACAHVFYQAGAKVILSARRKEELQRVKDDLMKHRCNVETFEPQIVVLDLEAFEAIPGKIAEALLFFGEVDILVNNGGVSYRGTVLATPLEVDRRMMDVNYFGQVALTKAVLPHMVKKRSGHIVAVSSVQGKLSIPYRSPYSASKHALQAFCDCLRAEMSDHNIQVSVISPGYIQTNLSKNALTASGQTHDKLDATTAAGMSPLYVARRILAAVEYGTEEQTLSVFSHKLAICVRNILPSAIFSIMRSRAKKQAAELVKK